MGYLYWNNALSSYLEVYSESRSKVSTRTRKTEINRILKLIKSPPNKITKTEIRELPKLLSKKYSQNTCSRTWSTFTNFLAFMNHPLYIYTKLRYIPQTEEHIHTYSESQLKSILDWATSTKLHYYDQRTACHILICLTTGMRPTEARNLLWNNINLETNSIHISATKTGVQRSVKTLPIVSSILSTYKTLQLEYTGITEYVFTPTYNPNKVISSSHFRKAYSLLSDLLGFRITSKWFRSTICKRIIESGGSYTDAAAVLGHRRIDTTQRYYHRIVSTERSRTAQYNALIGLIGETNEN